QLFARAQRVIPGGVDSPVRAFRSVGGVPYFVARGEGPYVWDEEGRRYVDWVQRAAADGTTYGAPTRREVELAETICSRVAGCEMVRLVSSGTEAGMSVLRVARGFTGRHRIVKFSGCYHG